MTHAKGLTASTRGWIGLALALCAAPVLGGVALETIPAPEQALDDGLPLVGAEDAQALVVGTPDGDVVLLTVEEFRLRAGRSFDGGATFDDESVIAGGPGQPAVRMIAAELGADGTIHVALVVLRPLGEFGLQYVRGHDLGTTWDDPVDLVPGSTPENEVLDEPLSLDVAAGPEGRVAIGFFKGGTFDDSEIHPHVITSSDGGSSWTAEVRVDPGSPGSREDLFRTIGVAIDPVGTVHVTYPGDRVVWHARSTDAGVTFEAAQALQLGLSPVLEVAADGGVIVASWDGLQFGQLSVFRSGDGGASFSLAYRHTNDSYSSFVPPAILSSSSGTVLLAAIEVTRSLLVHRSTDNGASFDAPIEIAPTASAGPTGRLTRLGPLLRLARTPAGSWVLAWEDLRDAGYADHPDIRVTVSTDDGVSWQPDRRADGGTASDGGNRVSGIVALNTDDALVVYQDRSADDGRAWNVHANRLTADPFTLGGDRRIDQDAGALHPGTESDPVVATDGAHHVYAAYGSYATGPFADIYVTASADGGSSFGPPRRVSTFPAGTGTWISTQPMLAATPDGYVYLAYYAFDLTSARQQVRFNRSTDFGAITGMTTVTS